MYRIIITHFFVKVNEKSCTQHRKTGNIDCKFEGNSECSRLENFLLVFCRKCGMIELEEENEAVPLRGEAVSAEARGIEKRKRRRR